MKPLLVKRIALLLLGIVLIAIGLLLTTICFPYNLVLNILGGGLMGWHLTGLLRGE